jgi:hypothetical protein
LVEYVGEFFSQGVSAKQIGGQRGVDGAGGEEFLLLLQTLLDRYVVDNVLLAAVLYAHVTVT